MLFVIVHFPLLFRLGASDWGGEEFYYEIHQHIGEFHSFYVQSTKHEGANEWRNKFYKHSRRQPKKCFEARVENQYLFVAVADDSSERRSFSQKALPFTIPFSFSTHSAFLRKLITQFFSMICELLSTTIRRSLSRNPSPRMKIFSACKRSHDMPQLLECLIVQQTD